MKVGDTVGFKADVETYGVIVKIKGRDITIEVYDSDTGDTAEYTVDKSRVWEN